ncbi:sulfotransferase family 2 domain-containing protein [Pseudohoeflea suaedae]|nr:sulfotransferase family 2 domain-containing protein [Pseudohoeflea suaedae]
MRRSVFFLHIPKTAGTSFNSVFRPEFGCDRFFDHCESRPPTILKEIQQDEQPFFASGHIQFTHCASLIRNPGVFSFTLVREPRAQLNSHLNWVKAYGDRRKPERLKEIAPKIAELARQLWDVDLNDIDRIRPILDNDVGMRLFDNSQTRYLRQVTKTRSITQECFETALKAYDSFSLVATMEDIRSANAYLKSLFPRIKLVHHENRSRLSGGIDFDNAKSREFYERFINYDRRLHQSYLERSREDFFPAQEARPKLMNRFRALLR